MSEHDDIGEGFKRLEALLEGENAPAGRMSFSGVDAMVAALTVAPDFVPPSRWMEMVWGGSTPVFDSLDEAQYVMAALMDFYNEIARSINEGAYAPLLYTNENGEADVREWCAGFVAGMSFNEKAWTGFVKSEYGYFLLPVYAHMPELTQGAIDPSDLEGFDPDADLAFMVARLYEHFRARRRPRAGRTAASSSGVKVGRNDPCPCGSGRKFKQCCIDAEQGASALPGLPTSTEQ